MKIAALFVLLFVSAVQFCSAQTDSTTISNSWIPKELRSDVLFLEKYSEISVDESKDIVKSNFSPKKRDEYLENIYGYNLVFRRKINSEIQTIIDEYELPNLSVSSTRDIRENLENNIRFVLKADYSAADLIKGKPYDPDVYIYDQQEDIRYQSFWGLEACLKSLKSYNWFAQNRITDEMPQSEIDSYVERNIPDEPRPRRRMRRSTKVGLVAILGYAALFIINALTE
jgi:hypothetical protein